MTAAPPHTHSQPRHCCDSAPVMRSHTSQLAERPPAAKWGPEPPWDPQHPVLWCHPTQGQCRCQAAGVLAFLAAGNEAPATPGAASGAPQSPVRSSHRLSEQPPAAQHRLGGVGRCPPQSGSPGAESCAAESQSPRTAGRPPRRSRERDSVCLPAAEAGRGLAAHPGSRLTTPSLPLPSFPKIALSSCRMAVPGQGCDGCWRLPGRIWPLCRARQG